MSIRIETLFDARPVISRYRVLGKLPGRLGRAPHNTCQKVRVMAGFKSQAWKLGGWHKMNLVSQLVNANRK